MAYAYYGVAELPDLNLSKYQTLAETGVDGVLQCQCGFLRLWNRICALHGLSMHFLLRYDPAKPSGNRLDIGILLQGAQPKLDAVSALMEASPLRDYYQTLQQSDAALDTDTYIFGCALTKRERTLAPAQQGGEPYHYVPEWQINEDCRLIDLYKTMSAINRPCCYRVDLFPAELAESTRNSFTKTIGKLRELTGYGDASRVQLSDVRQSRQRDSNAEEALRQYEKWVETLETTPHCRANIMAFADTELHARLLLDCAGSEAVSEGEYTLLPLGGAPFTALGRLGDKPQPFKKQMPDSLAFWPTSFTCEELSAFFRFPALFEGEGIDLPKETMPMPLADGLHLGRDHTTPPREVFFPIDKLTRHAFICGVPGSGKTNTMLHLTSSLWKEYGVPFLVLEPAKKEYRALLNDPAMRDVLVFSPAAGSCLPLAVNPFQFPYGLTLSEHIAALMQVFSGAFEVHGPVYYYLDRSIEQAYRNLGWDTDEVNAGEKKYPTLSEVQAILKDEIAQSDYDGEFKGNLNSFLQVRIGGLMNREMNEIFNVEESSLIPEDWLRCPAVIELEALPSNACNFLILLLCTLIRESLRANPYGDKEKALRHVICIEEAHNLISPQTTQSSQDFVDPKVSATAYIVKMLAEVRALREGIVIADQIPSAMASEVLKNTGLKIAHRMTSQDDRGLMGTTMSATEMQMEALSTYSTGEALVFYEGLQLPFKITMSQWGPAKASAGAYEGKGNDALYALLKENNEIFRMALIVAVSNLVKQEEKHGAALRRSSNAVIDELLSIHRSIADTQQISKAMPPKLRQRELERVQACKTLLDDLIAESNSVLAAVNKVLDRFQVSIKRLDDTIDALVQIGNDIGGSKQMIAGLRQSLRQEK